MGKYWRSVITTGEPESAYRYDALKPLSTSDALPPLEPDCGHKKPDALMPPIIVYWARRQSRAADAGQVMRKSLWRVAGESCERGVHIDGRC